MLEIDLKKCKKIFGHKVSFQNGAAYIEVYRIPDTGKDAMLVRYEGIVPEEFKEKTMQAIKDNKTPSGELYHFPEGDSF